MKKGFMNEKLTILTHKMQINWTAKNNVLSAVYNQSLQYF